MYYKEDWDQAKKRFHAFWEGEILDRCCIAVSAPRAGYSQVNDNPPATQPELIRWWLNPEDNLLRQTKIFESTYYGGEAYPAATMCLGASVMAAFYGAKAEFRPETVWYHPVITDWETFPWDFNPRENELYRITIETTRYFVEQCNGRYLVSLPELGSATDDLSLMRGMQTLLYDLLDDPKAVRQGTQTLIDTWCRVHAELYQIALPCNHEGCPLAWMQTWAPGPHYQMSCDFSAILSPQMFRDFIVPEIQQYLTANTYSVYHWDGPAAIKHLDALLEIEEIDAIQWTQGDGNPPASDARWIPYYKKIQAHGKKLILPFVETNEIETLLTELSGRGLFIRTVARSEAEARLLLSKIASWTHD